MQLIDRIERTISKNGAELHHIPLNGLKAVTIRVSGKTAVYADTDEFIGVCELQSAEAHSRGRRFEPDYLHQRKLPELLRSSKRSGFSFVIMRYAKTS